MYRKFKYIPLVMLGFLCCCQAPEEDLTIENQKNGKIIIGEELQIDKSKVVAFYKQTPTPTDSTDIVIHRNSLAWASYITGLILLEHPELKDSLQPHIVNQTIDLKLLVGDQPLVPIFRTYFSARMQQYVYQGQPGGASVPTPPYPITSTGGGGTPQIPSEAVEAYIAFLIEENCSELYFPKGLNVSLNEFTTLSHPLFPSSGIDTNDGIRLYFHDNGNLNGSEMAVNEVYVTNHDNVIIARPFSNPQNPYCDYTIDYTTFLEGPF